ncbi:MAG: Gfo/Idh/MocA family oxidoreductase [Candidatus Brocadiaceae bacterium]|jgi:predicted dehydrogenase
MDEAQREQIRQALGFSVPPYRTDFESQKTDYGIGVIGLHWVMLIMHLPAYRAARFNVVAAAEVLDERIEEARSKGFQLGRILRDWPGLLELDEVEVIDCTFGHGREKERRRLEVVEAAAEAGKHLMIHKPVAMSLSLAEEMARVAEEAGIKLAVNQNCRYNPACYSVKQLLTEERLGRPGIIEVQNYWRGDPREKSDDRGAWVAHVIHHADLIRWWVGETCVSVFSEAGMLSNVTTYEFADGTIAYHMENHSGVEAHETYMRVMAEGGVVRARHNWNWHFGAPGEYEKVEVFPDTARPGVRLPLPEHIYEPIWSDINPFTPHEGPYYDLAGPIAGMMGSMGALMRGVERDERPDNDVRGAIESLRMCLAAQLSAQTGHPVDPREVPSDTTAER